MPPALKFQMVNIYYYYYFPPLHVVYFKCATSFQNCNWFRMRVRSQVKRAYNTAAEEDNNRKESLVY